ncbi:MAG: TIGR02186 family protein [Pseudomonadota bacterium]
MPLPLALLLLVLMVLPARSEEVVAELSQSQVSITAGFSGSEIVVFGAVKRNAPTPGDGPLDVIVAVTGPSEPVIVRRKERRFGIWINGPGVRISSAPSLYALATTGPLDQIISHTDGLRYRVGLDQAIRLIDAPVWVDDPAEYREALVRLRSESGLYFQEVGSITLREDTLFHADIDLPAQLVEGDYEARIFLLRGREVVDIHTTSIQVRKVGLERWLYNMAHEQSLLYGFLSIAVALAAGWLASAFFRFFFP